MIVDRTNTQTAPPQIASAGASPTHRAAPKNAAAATSETRKAGSGLGPPRSAADEPSITVPPSSGA